MKPVLLAMFCASMLCGKTQRVVDVGKNDINATNQNFFMAVGGTPFVLAKFSRLVDGSPYFSDYWLRGNVTLSGGKEYWGLKLKLDLLNNELHYQDASENEMIATSGLSKVVLFDSIAQQVFTFVHSDFIKAQYSEVQKGFYQLLAEGAYASFFKQQLKILRENQPYGSATVEQTIATTRKFLVLYKGSLLPVKKLKDIPDILTDKRKEIDDFIRKNDLAGKRDEDFVAVINFYNGLKTP
jgi:hypothetical protein